METPGPRVTSIRKLRMGAESDQADREYWLALTPAERVLETWRLSAELWEMKGWNPGEPGLCRTVARVVHR